MPRPYISLQLRRLVAERADYLCEYCLIAEADSLGCELDHIISVKHGGATEANNFAYACAFCFFLYQCLTALELESSGHRW